MLPQLVAVFLSFGGLVAAQLPLDTTQAIVNAYCGYVPAGLQRTNCVSFLSWEIEATIDYECGNRTEAFVTCLGAPPSPTTGDPVSCQSVGSVGTIDPGVVTCIQAGNQTTAEIAACLSASSQVSTECKTDVYTAYDTDCSQLYGEVLTFPVPFVQCALSILQRCGSDPGDGCFYGDCRGPGPNGAEFCPIPVYPPGTLALITPTSLRTPTATSVTVVPTTSSGPRPTPTTTSVAVVLTTSSGLGPIVPSPTTTQLSLPTMTDTVSYCNAFANVPQDAATCTALENTYDISFAQLFAWNPSILDGCINLELGYAYCVGVSEPTPPGYTQPNIIPACNAYTLAISGFSNCPAIVAEYDLTFGQFYAWNPDIRSNCTQLDGGFAYCVGISGVVPPAPTSPCGINTCDAYYTVVSGDTCYGIWDAFQIQPADFLAWNPAVGETCENVLVGTAYCVGISGPAPTSTTCIVGATPSLSSAATPTSLSSTGVSTGLSGAAATPSIPSAATTTTQGSTPTTGPNTQPNIPYFSLQLTLLGNSYYVSGGGQICTDISQAAALFIDYGTLFNIGGGYVSADPIDDPISVVLAETFNGYAYSTTFSFQPMGYNTANDNTYANSTGSMELASGSQESYILQWQNEAFGEPNQLATFCVSNGYVYAVLVNAPIPASCVIVELGVVQVDYAQPSQSSTLSPSPPGSTMARSTRYHHHHPGATSTYTSQGLPTGPPLNFCPPGQKLLLKTSTIWS